MTTPRPHPYDLYLDAINQADPAIRLQGLGSAAVEAFHIRSPAYEAWGLNDVCQAVAVAMTSPAGRVRLARATEIDEHHGVGRVEFAVFSAAGERVGTGLHVFETDGDKLTRLTVFGGPLKSLPD